MGRFDLVSERQQTASFRIVFLNLNIIRHALNVVTSGCCLCAERCAEDTSSSSCESIAIIMLIILSLYEGSAAQIKQKIKKNLKTKNGLFWITAVWRSSIIVVDTVLRPDVLASQWLMSLRERTKTQRVWNWSQREHNVLLLEFEGNAHRSLNSLVSARNTSCS